MGGEPSYEVLEEALRRQMRAASQMVFPELLRVEEALGEELDAGSFAFGVLAAAYVVGGNDVLGLVKRDPDLVRGFIANARAARPE